MAVQHIAHVYGAAPEALPVDRTRYIGRYFRMQLTEFASRDYGTYIDLVTSTSARVPTSHAMHILIYTYYIIYTRT